MASKYAFVVGCNARYLPGLNALLNSLDLVGNTHDVYVLAYKLPVSYLKAVQDAGFSFRTIFEQVDQKEVDWLGEAEVLMRKRYGWPAMHNRVTEAGERYEAVCVLDADMFFCHNVDRYLEIAASSGLVLGCTLEQKRRYGDPNHQFPAESGQYLIPTDFWNARDLCCAPLFVGPKWWDALEKSYKMVNDYPYGQGRFRAPDMDALNICLIEAGSYDKTIPLSQHTWTGLHECLMKAHTRAIEMHDRPFTEDGEEINIVHGQYWNKTWRGWQIENQLGMIDREFEGSPSMKSRAKGSFELVLRWYKKNAVEHKVNINDFLRFIETRAPEPASDVMDLL